VICLNKKDGLIVAERIEPHQQPRVGDAIQFLKSKIGLHAFLLPNVADLLKKGFIRVQ